MKEKRLLCFIALCYFYSLSLNSQSWVEQMKDPSANFYDVQKSFENYWKDSSKAVYVETFKSGSTQPVLEKKLPGWKAFKRWENQMEPRLYPSGDRSIMINAMHDYYTDFYSSQRKGNPQNPTVQAANWTYVGPATVPSGGGGAGRVNFVRFDPANTSIIYVGAPAGGLWKSTNGGTSWSTQTDNLAVIGCTDLAINPNNSQIMYLATGDGDSDDTYSVGVLKTTNGGTTWNTTGLNWSVLNLRTIRRLLINPQNPNTIYAASSSGIYRSRNAGATWTQVATAPMVDIEFNPNDTTIIYACGSKFYKSTDAGSSYVQITTGTPPSGSVSRMSIAVSPADPSYVYILASGTDYGFYGLYRSTNSGTSFVTQATVSPNLLGWSISGNDTRGQGWYDLALAVSPIDAEYIVVGGINIWASADGGVNWTNQSYWAASGSNYVHADIHALEFPPGGNSTYFAGTDGGIFKTTSTGASWSSISNGLQIGQIYKIGNSKISNNMLLTGWQDNGSSRYNGTSWARVTGGDGMECIIDWSNNNIQYTELYYGEIRKTTTGGNVSTSIVTSTGTGVNEKGAWVTPYIQSPTTAATLFVGKNQVYKSMNAGSTWAQVGSIPSGGTIRSLANAPSDENYIYAAKLDNIYVCTDGINFTNVTGNLPVGTALTSGAITYIAVHPTDPNKLWITISGYSSGNKVFYSPNAGTTWTNYSTGLPNLPVNCIVYDRNSINNGLYVGTDVGVYYRDNTLSSWQVYDAGLPNVIVNELEIQYAAGKLRAATYGRGVWESNLNTTSTGIEFVDDTQNFKVYPNPTNENFMFSFTSDSKSDFIIELHNALGQKLYKEEIKNIQGDYSKQVNMKQYGKGIYFFTIITEEKRVVKKIVVN